MVVKEENFSHGGVGGGGLFVAAAGKFLHDLLDAGTGHIGFGQPVEGQEKIFGHSAGGAQFGTNKRIGECAQIF